MYLWQKAVSRQWLEINEYDLRELAGDRLAIIERPNRKRLQIELASESRADLERLARNFGGRIRKLPANWLKRAFRQKTKPIKVGDRQLIIPAAAAFGTGEHATTAMSLRFLEKISRSWNRGWSMADLGTGSGILALAAKSLGATRVVGIDNDPIAISTAKHNAQLNKIHGIRFQIADVRAWKPPARIQILTANLFSELLVEIVPEIRHAERLILSGILRNQERDVRRALARSNVLILEVRRRGKWVALLAGRR